ncbi:ABC transporter permease [Pseudactinotalea suaedae]|uniref:ABC transporter permease n=1 Tax=Pseudactinotalea suaedae TaxID=1524924 RepID=UPI0012E21A67|nr:ABC transporter permease [Pseudactinotalea suaedae]
MTALRLLTLTEIRLFLREWMNWAFVIGLPPLLLVILGAVPDLREPDPGLGGLRAIDVYTPILIAMAVCFMAFTSLPTVIADYRAKGVLRRMRTTPVRPQAVLGAHLVMSLLMAVLTLTLLLVLSSVVSGVALPGNPVGYLAAYLLMAASLFALGLLVAALAPSGQAASGIGTVLFFPVLFFGGLWVPREAMNDTLRTISDFSPLGAGVQSLQDAGAGGWPQLVPLLVLVGWTLVAGGLAARYFRWE